MKHLLLSLLFCLPSFVFSQVVINEYSCSNVSGPTDAYGEREDWIELYNTTAAAVDLTGWYLSDNQLDQVANSEWQYQCQWFQNGFLFQA